MTTTFFVNAPPTKADTSEQFVPGYVVSAGSKAEALRLVRAFRKGTVYANDLVEVVRK